MVSVEECYVARRPYFGLGFSNLLQEDVSRRVEHDKAKHKDEEHFACFLACLHELCICRVHAHWHRDRVISICVRDELHISYCAPSALPQGRKPNSDEGDPVPTQRVQRAVPAQRVRRALRI